MSSVLYIECADRVSVTTPAKEGPSRWTAPGYYALSSRSFRGMFTYICHDAYQSSGNSPSVDHSFHAAGLRLIWCMFQMVGAFTVGIMSHIWRDLLSYYGSWPLGLLPMNYSGSRCFGELGGSFENEL